jgi:ABC-type multidrug transport system permease subunit
MICCIVGNSLGFFVGTLFKEPRLASVLTPLILMPLMMFSGMYTRLDSLADWIGWIQYISPFKYALHALMVNEFHNETYRVLVGSFDFVFDYRKDLMIKLDFW